MDKTDIRQIALYLSGKLPPYFDRFSRLRFFELLEIQYGITTDKATFYREQANKYEEEFYQLVFEYLYTKSLESNDEKKKFQNFINLVWYKTEWKINYDTLSIQRKALKEEKNSQTKWKLLESFLIELFSSIDWLNIVANNLNNGDEELDIVLQNNIHEWFFANLNSPLLLVEAKNWKDNVPTKVARDFTSKTHLHKNLTRVGILVTVNGYTGEVDEVLKRLWATDELLVLISWDDIEYLLSDHIDPKEWLMKLFSKSLK